MARSLCTGPLRCDSRRCAEAMLPRGPWIGPEVIEYNGGPCACPPPCTAPRLRPRLHDSTNSIPPCCAIPPDTESIMFPDISCHYLSFN